MLTVAKGARCLKQKYRRQLRHGTRIFLGWFKCRISEGRFPALGDVSAPPFLNLQVFGGLGVPKLTMEGRDLQALSRVAAPGSRNYTCLGACHAQVEISSLSIVGVTSDKCCIGVMGGDLVKP